MRGVDKENNMVTGAFYTNSNSSGGWSNEYESSYNLFFDASRSNPIYGNSDTVQPPAIILIAQIKY